MAIGSRHIRHDFNTWVDWEQKSVRSACGVTTKRHLAGIPGITEQPRVVDLGDRKVWGWCARCVNSVWSSVDNNAQDFDIDSRVRELYSDARLELAEQRQWMMDRAQADRERRRRLAGTSNTV